MATHGLSKTRIYKIWKGMKYRCYNENCPQYLDYGGRGIYIAENWTNKQNGFLSFYLWSLNNNYNEKMTIERVDVNRGYEESNCKWITKAEQSLNTRNSKMIEINGVTKNLCQWAKESGLSHSTIQVRLKRGVTGDNLLAKTSYKEAEIKSGIIGVRWDTEKKRWFAQIKNKFGGSFVEMEDAIKRRLELELIHFPEEPPQLHLFEKYGIEVK